MISWAYKSEINAFTNYTFTYGLLGGKFFAKKKTKNIINIGAK